MTRGNISPAGQQNAADSPRLSESPPPSGVQGDLELELLGLANALYNLGTTVVNDLTKEKDKPGGGGKPVGHRVNDVIQHLATIEDMSQHVTTMIPMQVLSDIDNARNPLQLTKERLERAATENQYMNGQIHALNSYRRHLDEVLVQTFPELAEFLVEPHDEASLVNVTVATSDGPDQVSMNGAHARAT
ncbi:hypothetical protein IEO21_03295 [Rhodonia placenta]|uniref:Mediator of RNA polymerase II transcription subunit 10 n=1 Tax=Rhodonia placenta TaxID=104341 RepID=A0A8H7P5W3_9APHY|nr:hypothetical protein IEO21_03295 [Postia placenta]